MIEVLITLGVVALLVLVVLPQVLRPRVRSSRINCVSNLKQVGLGFRMWANDNYDVFPWEIPTKQGGSQELAGRGNTFVHFAVASNEFVSPKILLCPSDKVRNRAMAWASLCDANLSYGVGLDARKDQIPRDLILSSDRNVTGGVLIAKEVYSFSATNTGWDQRIHGGFGNLGLTDGSAMQVTVTSLQKQLAEDQQARQTNVTRLAMPLPLKP